MSSSNLPPAPIEPRTGTPAYAPPAADVLDRVRVAAPCTMSWDAMPGGERVRSCEKCAHKVYNLSAMTAAEAAQLVARAEGKNAERVCVRFYRRSDGTMLTADCPVGARAVRQRMARRTSVAFAAVGALFGMSLMGKTRDEQPRLVQWVLNAIDPPAPPVWGPAPASPASPATPVAPVAPTVMGKIALPMAPATPEPPKAHEQGEMMTVTVGGIGPAAPLASSFDGGPEPAPPPVDKSFLQGADANRGGIAAAQGEPVRGARVDPFVSYTIVRQNCMAVLAKNKKKAHATAKTVSVKEITRP